MDNIEQEARGLGWVPQEEFRGDQSKWVDAEAFVQRGKDIMPILRQNNKKLQADIQRLAGENQRLAHMFTASQESIVELQAFHEDNLKARLAAQKRELAGQLAEAREAGDTMAEVEIQSQIAELNVAAKREPKQAPREAPQQQAPQPDPDMAEWLAANPWFNTDQRKTARAIGIAQVLRSDPDNDHLQGRAFYDRVVQEMQPQGSQHAKVGGGRPSGEGGQGRGNGKDYDSLPPEAKEACNKQAKKLVGEGRAFKDTASWNAYYAKIYFAKEE